ncbi:hypothetical protein [Catellatospora sichuanensis]|uniref:hypothetical protein n=1 Tax=Catellatospora sichuanensis TaxID=1969805 RepID=UPI001181F6C7|nr:hypothetical protein [Catellatospora sichuanensis]
MTRIDPQDLPALTINLEYGDSAAATCLQLPLEYHTQFTAPHKNYPGYGFLEVNASVLALPDDIEKEWWGTPDSYWMRQKVRRALKLGYEFALFEHDDHLDDIHEINLSLDERQGRPMSESYRTRPSEFGPQDDQSCPRHRSDHFGVLKDGKLLAYTLAPACGEMMLFSRILGHGAHMEDGIMNLLVYEAAKHRREHSGTRYAVYYVHDSGTPGLQFFKRKMGFVGHRVEWQLHRPFELSDPEY